MGRDAVAGRPHEKPTGHRTGGREGRANDGEPAHRLLDQVRLKGAEGAGDPVIGLCAPVSQSCSVPTFCRLCRRWVAPPDGSVVAMPSADGNANGRCPAVGKLLSGSGC